MAKKVKWLLSAVFIHFPQTHCEAVNTKTRVPEWFLATVFLNSWHQHLVFFWRLPERFTNPISPGVISSDFLTFRPVWNALIPLRLLLTDTDYAISKPRILQFHLYHSWSMQGLRWFTVNFFSCRGQTLNTFPLFLIAYLAWLFVGEKKREKSTNPRTFLHFSYMYMSPGIVRASLWELSTCSAKKKMSVCLAPSART